MTDLTTQLWAAMALVDQLGAEMHDPATPPERRIEIRQILARLYREMTRLQQQSRPPS